MAGRQLVLVAVAFALAAMTSACHSKVADGRADGAAIFSQVCARCHGPSGVPSAANVARLGVKPLNSVHVQEQMTDADIRHQILHGSKNKQMPSFVGALSEAQIRAVIAHVRTLGPAHAAASAAGAASVAKKN